jgi:soluble lytic murein transglycosylase-like protein
MVAIQREPPPAAAAVSADAIPLKLRRRGGTPRQVFAIALIGTLTLALFASRDLASWSERLGDSPAALLQGIAVAWDDRMAALGLTRPHEALRDFLRGALDRQW